MGQWGKLPLEVAFPSQTTSHSGLPRFLGLASWKEATYQETTEAGSPSSQPSALAASLNHPGKGEPVFSFCS